MKAYSYEFPWQEHHRQRGTSLHGNAFFPCFHGDTARLLCDGDGDGSVGIR